MNNMDHQSKQTKLETLLTQFTKSLFLKHATQLLLSISLLSLLVTNFSKLSFLYSSNSNFSTFPIQLFTHTLNKNYTFLLCNGIVVFVAKISSLKKKSTQSNNNLTLEPYKYYDHETIVMESRVILLEKEEVEDDHVEENVDIEKGREDNEDRDMEEEETNFIEENEEEECEYEGEDEEERELEEEDNEEGDVRELDEWSSVEEDEEDEDGGNGVISTEELNKRFDEFIKKMKEGLRIEAQQQYLVMVN